MRGYVSERCDRVLLADAGTAASFGFMDSGVRVLDRVVAEY